MVAMMCLQCPRWASSVVLLLWVWSGARVVSFRVRTDEQLRVKGEGYGPVGIHDTCGRRGCESPATMEEQRTNPRNGDRGTLTDLRRNLPFAYEYEILELWREFQPTGVMIPRQCGCNTECVMQQTCCADYVRECGERHSPALKPGVQQQDDKPSKQEADAEPCGDPDPEAARTELKEALAKVYGLAAVKQAAEDLIDQAVVEELMKRQAIVAKAPQKSRRNFAFLGPPGTGKTTIAKLLSEAFCKLGTVKTKSFLEVRPDELIGEFVGQTQKAVKERLEPGLGGVIFIDEAYLITSSGDGRGPNQFQQEAVGVLMKLMDEHADDTVFVFAGYNDDMEAFFKSNDGLKRRIPQIFRFEPFSVDDILSILQLKAHLEGVGLVPDIKMDGMNMLVSEFVQFVQHKPHLLPAPGTEALAEGFVRYVQSRVGMVYMSGFSDNPDFSPTETWLHAEQPPFEEGLRMYEEKYLNGDIKSLLERVPVGMRTKSNGGLVDTIMSGAYRVRSSRILKEKLLTSEGCMPSLPIFQTDPIARQLFERVCPCVLLYSGTDMSTATQSAIDSWGDDIESDDTVMQLVVKALRPATEQWQNYGRYLAEEAMKLSTGDPHTARVAMPIFAEADRAMKIAEGMMANNCGAKNCAEIGFPPQANQWPVMIQQWLAQNGFLPGPVPGFGTDTTMIED